MSLFSEGLVYNIDFIVIALIADIILYASVKLKYRNLSYRNKLYKELLVIAAVAALLDMAGAITISYVDQIPHFLVLITNGLYYNVFAGAAYLFSCYIEANLYQKKDYKRNKVNLALLVVNVILDYALMFTGNLFTFTEKGVDYPPLHIMVYLIPLYFILYSIIIFMANYRTFKGKSVLLTLLVGVFATSFILFQVFFSTNILFSDMIISLALLVLFFSLETPDYYKLEDSLTTELMTSLAGTVDARDPNVNGHSFRVAEVSSKIAGKLGMSENEQKEVYYIGLLHDIGKIAVPDSILYNTKRLTDEQYEEAKYHTTAGANILKNITVIPDMATGARWHHERYDGKGYPDGLKGEEIPMVARIVCVADAYDAMVAQRRYGHRFTQEEARDEIIRGKGTQFDPNVADCMIALIDEDKAFELNGDKYSEKDVDFDAVLKLERQEEWRNTKSEA